MFHTSVPSFKRNLFDFSFAFAFYVRSSGPSVAIAKRRAEAEIARSRKKQKRGAQARASCDGGEETREDGEEGFMSLGRWQPDRIAK
jgi:hypothetical protein